MIMMMKDFAYCNTVNFYIHKVARYQTELESLLQPQKPKKNKGPLPRKQKWKH